MDAGADLPHDGVADELPVAPESLQQDLSGVLAELGLPTGFGPSHGNVHRCCIHFYGWYVCVYDFVCICICVCYVQRTGRAVTSKKRKQKRKGKQNSSTSGYSHATQVFTPGMNASQVEHHMSMFVIKRLTNLVSFFLSGLHMKLKMGRHIITTRFLACQLGLDHQ